jgi:hypothetical protein
MQVPSDHSGQEFELSDQSEIPEFDLELILEQLLQDPSVSQFSIRHQLETEETISTFVRCDMASGQQRLVLHVPFYPHFRSIPRVAASILDGHQGRTRVTDYQKFGARVEIALEEPSLMPLTVLVEIIATAKKSDDLNVPPPS